MAAYGVIGGFIGAAIAAVITPILIKRARKRYNKKEHNDPESYRPGASWFGFLVLGVGGTACGIFMIYWLLTTVDFTKISNIRYLGLDSMLFFVFSIIMPFFMFFLGILFACWTGSFIGAKITVSKERLVIDHAAKMPSDNHAHIHFWQFGRHHLDLRWDEIRELRADRNQMKLLLHNGEVYYFPIGWYKEGARFAVARHKKINPWE